MSPSISRSSSGVAHRGFPAVELDTGAANYVGEPITLSLKDADITNVLKNFAKLTGLNVVIDPTTSGSVTVELHDVPWDQALELILDINELGFSLENNVLYVAPRKKLLATTRR